MNYIQQTYKGLNDFWRYFLVVIIVFIGWQVIGIIPFTLVGAYHVENHSEFLTEMQDMFLHVGIDSNLYLFVMLISFVFGLVSLILGVEWIHKRKFKTIVTSRENIDWKRVFFAFWLWFFVSVSLMVVGYLLAPEYFTWNFKPVPYFTLLIVSFLFIPLQTSFEELLFRGYFMQGLGILVKNKWFPLLFTSVVFGLLHMANPEVDKLGPLIMVYYIGTGLFLGIITLMDEGTELAIGFHAANNITAAIFITQTWTVFQTEALFVETSEPSIGFETFLPVFVIFPILIFVFAKKYHWTNFSEKLFGKVEKPKSENEDFFEGDSFIEV